MRIVIRDSADRLYLLQHGKTIVTDSEKVTGMFSNTVARLPRALTEPVILQGRLRESAAVALVRGSSRI